MKLNLLAPTVIEVDSCRAIKLIIPTNKIVEMHSTLICFINNVQLFVGDINYKWVHSSTLLFEKITTQAHYIENDCTIDQIAPNSSCDKHPRNHFHEVNHACISSKSIVFRYVLSLLTFFIQ